MLRKLTILTLSLMFLSAATFAFAEDVFVTKKGQKYHKEDCRLIKNKNSQPLSKEEALEKKLKPCGLCYKQDLSLAPTKGEQKKVR